MSHRVIRGLKWARSGTGPELPTRRPRGAKALGIRYERALARALPAAQHGQWWEFEDSAGHGWCQTDLIGEFGGQVVILEAKYSWVEKGHEQMEQLYAPVVEMATGRAPLMVQVCKNLRQGVRHVSGDLEAAIAKARSGRSVLHWLGVGPLFAQPQSVPLAPRPDSIIGLPKAREGAMSSPLFEFDPTA